MDEIGNYIIIISAISLMLGHRLISKNNTDMMHDPLTKTYYENNVYAKYVIIFSLILYYLIKYYFNLNSIYQYIPALLILYGYSILWSNTAKMQSDPNATKYYQQNKNASLLVGIPSGILVLYLTWYNFIRKSTDNKIMNDFEKTINDY